MSFDRTEVSFKNETLLEGLDFFVDHFLLTSSVLYKITVFSKSSPFVHRSLTAKKVLNMLNFKHTSIKYLKMLNMLNSD